MMQDDDGIEGFKHYGAPLFDDTEEQSENDGNETIAPDPLAGQVKELEKQQTETYQWVEDMGSVGVAI